MKGLMLGIVDGILNGLGVVLEAIITAVVVPVLKLAIERVLFPIIRVLIKVIMEAVGFLLYIISSFLLKLIDFVEMLFRALAGLEPKIEGNSIEMSLDGRSGDILIQLIRHPDIQQAFLAMCIVGIFLLVVTTVFQVIKVEYTTEGAKNSKTPIFQKAFKGLANLMLLPLLVVMGIVFANQLLGLLDKATTVEGKNPTISGLLFVTSAESAFHRNGAWYPEFNDNQPEIITTVLRCLGDGFGEYVPRLFDNDYWEAMQKANYELDEEQRNAVNDSFISQSPGCVYYKIVDVIKYYRLADINYVLMIFGGVMVIKCLFFACFGMINRLYKCAMLFIISPVIIGMTPINEGGLGKWRGAFIGQVLAGYGTILSINLFFIIVRVLLKIEINFVSKHGADGFLTDSFMTMLFKAILVLAGCTLIEKFAKEIGGYFGADDAISSGKETTSEMGNVAMAGVKAAAGIGLGGLAVAKGVGGIANKIGGKGTQIGAGREAYKKSMAESKGSGKSYLDRRADAKKASFEAKKDWRVEKAQKKTKANLYKNMSKEDKDNPQAFYQQAKDAEAEQKGILGKFGWTEDDLKEEGGMDIFKEVQPDEYKQYMDATKKREQAQDKIKIYEEGGAAYNELKENSFGTKIKKSATSSVLRSKSALTGLALQGAKNLPGYKFISGLRGAEEEGAKALGGHYESATAEAKTKREDRIREVGTMGTGWAEHAYTAAGALIIAKAVGEEMKTATDKMVRDFGTMLERIQRTGSGFTNKDSEQYKSFMANQYMNATDRGYTGSFDAFRGLIESKEQIQVTAEMIGADGFDEKAIQKALSEAMKNGGTTEAITNAIKKVAEDLGEKGNASMIKTLTEIIEKKINEIKK